MGNDDEMVSIQIPRRYIEGFAGTRFLSAAQYRVTAGDVANGGDWGNAVLHYAAAEVAEWQKEQASKVTLDTPPGIQVRHSDPGVQHVWPWFVVGPTYTTGGERSGWLAVQVNHDGRVDMYRPDQLQLVDVDDD